MSYKTSRSGEVTAGPFDKGMNNKQSDHSLPEGSARNLVNCDLDISGKARRRKGSTRVYSGLGLKGGYSCPVGVFFIEGQSLRELNTDNTSSSLYENLTGSTYAYSYFNGITYFSDNATNIKIKEGVAIPWGLPIPVTPIMSEISGSYGPGVYLAAYSWVDEDGLESGASSVGKITLANNAGIAFNVLPGLVPGAVTLRIYLSTPNGKVLYHVADTTNSSYAIMAGSYDSGSALELLHVGPPPLGNIMAIYNGRMYISTGKVVYYSEPYSFDHFRSGSFLQFPFEVTIMEPVTGGIFFASNKDTNFYSGNPEDGFNVIPKFNYGGLYGSSKRIPNSDEVIWMSQRGLIRGSANGECTNIQEQNVATESGTSGATLIREHDGFRQVIASINNPTTSSLAATSFIDAEIIRRS